jgi:hypothetical protein
MTDMTLTSSHVLRYDAAAADIHLMRRVVWGGDPLDRIGVGIETNLIQELWLWPTVGFGWGPQRREGTTLALAILDRLLPRNPGQVCKEWHQPLACSPWAYRMCYQLYVEILQRVPYWGERLAGHHLRLWLAKALQGWQADGIDLNEITAAQAFPSWPW